MGFFDRAEVTTSCTFSIISWFASRIPIFWSQLKNNFTCSRCFVSIIGHFIAFLLMCGTHFIFHVCISLFHRARVLSFTDSFGCIWYRSIELKNTLILWVSIFNNFQIAVLTTDLIWVNSFSSSFMRLFVWVSGVLFIVLWNKEMSLL